MYFCFVQTNINAYLSIYLLLSAAEDAIAPSISGDNKRKVEEKRNSRALIERAGRWAGTRKEDMAGATTLRRSKLPSSLWTSSTSRALYALRVTRATCPHARRMALREAALRLLLHAAHVPMDFACAWPAAGRAADSWRSEREGNCRRRRRLRAQKSVHHAEVHYLARRSLASLYCGFDILTRYLSRFFELRVYVLARVECDQKEASRIFYRG